MNPNLTADTGIAQPLQLHPWRELTLLMLVGMEISWVTPWFRSLTPQTYAIPAWRAALILTGIMVISLWVERGLFYFRFKTSIRQIVTMCLLIMSLLIGFKTLLYPHESIPFGQMLSRPIQNLADVRILIPDEFVIAMTVLIGWWRGIALAQERIGPGIVRDHFLVGLMMFILFSFFNTLITGETPGSFIFIFLFCALLGMSAARFSILSALRGGRLTEFDRRWFFGVLFASVFTVSLALFFGELFSTYLQWVAYLIIGLFGLIVLVIWMILAPILVLIIQFFSQSGKTSPLIQQITTQVDKFQTMMLELMQRIGAIAGIDKVSEALARWTPRIKLILLLSILGMVVAGIILWLGIQLWQERKRRQLIEERVMVFTRVEFWRLLQAVIRKQWESLKTTLGNAADIRIRARMRAAERIRQVYAELMELCEEIGKPRPEAQTPLEFLPQLILLFPENEIQVASITQAYLSVRYGELPETHQEVNNVEEAWQLVKQAGNEMLEHRRQQNNQPGRLNRRLVDKPRHDR